jgi:dTDP-4-amino-4,6-dideoxygalactose transaminase
MDCGLYWGTHPFMTEDDVRYIVATVEQYFQQADRAAPQRQRG